MSAKEQEFLSNEAIEGISLADRMAQGPLPPEDALRYSIEIGTALNKAHKRGAVHGKLSAHCILLTRTGARIVRPTPGTDLDALPYRAPEQITGEDPDWRSDIFSYGDILYEMVSGRRAFFGEGQALDRAILERPPAALLSKAPIHAAMEGVIAGCLEKDPGRRRQRVQNAVIELKLAGRSLTRMSDVRPARVRRPIAAEVVSNEPADIRPKRPRIFSPVQFPDEIQAVPYNSRRQWLLMAFFGALGLAVLAILFLSVWSYFHPNRPAVYKFPVAPPENTTYRMPAISPDGKYLAVQLAGADGKPMLWLRPLDAEKPVLIPGTEGAFAPFWSPDSEYLAFFADKSLKKIRIAGGPAERICDAEGFAGGGTWSQSGTIVFAPGQGGVLYQVPASGGKPQPLTKLNPSQYQRADLWPQFLPDGKHFVFFVLSDIETTTGVYAGAVDSPDAKMLFASQTNAVFSAGADSSTKGYLLYMRDRSLMGVGFNADRLQLRGDPNLLQNDVGAVQSLSLAPISISQNAILVYQSVGVATRQLAWMDRTGKTLASVADGGEWGPPRIAPDASRAVVAKLGKDKRTADLWMVDPAGAATEFTSGPAHKGSPVWSPDGSRIAYFSNLDGSYEIVTSPANNGGKVEPLVKMAQAVYPTDWSSDGKFIIFGVLTPSSKSDIWAMSMPDHRTGPVLDTIYAEGYAALSPDGKWLAYQSDESQHTQVYVQPFDGITRGTKRRYEISPESGGGLPRWRADGQELYFITATGRMMSVAVHPNGDDFQFDEAKPMFQTRPIPQTWNLYDVSHDGQKFLVNLPLEWSSASPITVVTNWTEKLKD